MYYHPLVMCSEFRALTNVNQFVVTEVKSFFFIYSVERLL